MAVKVDLILNDGSFSAKIKQAAQGFVQMANAIKTAKNAQQAFNNVLKANPFGLISTAAIAGAEALYKYVTGVFDAEKAQAELNATIESTKMQLDTMADNLDFDLKIAKAAGASWQALHKLKLEAALTAESLAFETMTKAPFGSEERSKAEAMWNKARERLNSVRTEGTVDTLQSIYKTGRYAEKPTRARGGGRSTVEKEPWVNRLSPSDIQMQGLATNGLFGNPVEPEGYVYLKMKDLTSSLAESFKNLKIKEPDKEKTTAEKLSKFTSDYDQVVGGVSSIAGGLEQMGIKLPEEIHNVLNVVQGISSILTGIAAIVSIISIATQANTTASWIDAIVPFSRGGTLKGQKVIHAAEGYTVPGKYGYDAVPAMLTSGETVLNAAQTNNLASRLQGGGIGNLNLSATVSGEQIRLVLNNNGRRTGRGEYVQTNFR